MAAVKVIAVQVICDRCRVPAWIADDPHYGEAYWPSLERACEELSGPHRGWIACKDSQMCPACVAIVACQVSTHDWQPWRPTVALGEERLHIRSCLRCGQQQIGSILAGRA